jgi:hypothetical protein
MTQLNHKYALFTIALISVVFTQILPAQSFEQMDQLYQQKKYDQLKKLVDGNNAEDPAIIFFKNVFNENGDESVRIYESLFNKVQGKLKGLIARKISEYYYAKGFYVKSREYDRFAVYDAPEETVVPQKKDLYQIQVGAFGYQENANRMQELLGVRKIQSTVKKRIINDKTLYCVWIAGSDTYRDTVQLAEELKQKYKLNYQIINP